MGRIPESFAAQRPDAFLWNEVPESAKLGGFIEEVEGSNPSFSGFRLGTRANTILSSGFCSRFHGKRSSMLALPRPLRGTNAAVMIGALASDYEQLSRRWQTLTSHSAPARQRGVVASSFLCPGSHWSLSDVGHGLRIVHHGASFRGHCSAETGDRPCTDRGSTLALARVKRGNATTWRALTHRPLQVL